MTGGAAASVRGSGRASARAGARGRAMRAAGPGERGWATSMGAGDCTRLGSVLLGQAGGEEG
jgi:hypothetical protein